MLARSKLGTIEVLISKASFNSYINHDEFVLVNNVLREDNEMKEKNKTLIIIWKYYIKTMGTYCVSWNKNIVSKNVRITKQNRLMLLSNCAAYGKKKPRSLKIKNSIK